MISLSATQKAALIKSTESVTEVNEPWHLVASKQRSDEFKITTQSKISAGKLKLANRFLPLACDNSDVELIT